METTSERFDGKPTYYLLIAPVSLANDSIGAVTSGGAPTPAALASEVEALQMTDVVFGQVGTVFGPATTMRSTLTVRTGGSVPGYVLWARNSSGVFSIQVTAGSEEVVEAHFGIVLRTLQPIPPALN